MDVNWNPNELQSIDPVHDNHEPQWVTALHVAARNRNVEAVKSFLKRGARTDIRDELGRTAFQTAMRKGNEEVLEIIEEHGWTE